MFAVECATGHHEHHHPAVRDGVSKALSPRLAEDEGLGVPEDPESRVGFGYLVVELVRGGISVKTLE